MSLLPHLLGGGRWEGSMEAGLRLTLPPTPAGYANAQLDDYHDLPRRRFRWRPPVLLSLRARASRSDPVGTLGFGFWNDPLSFGQAGATRASPALPRAIWFFHGSPPHDLQLVAGVQGWGWKATALNSMRAPALLPLAPLGLALMLAPGLRTLAVRIGQRLLRAHETVLEHDLAEWHDYELRWHSERVEFSVDGSTVMRSSHSPGGPLGFVTWIDNQFMSFSPRGGLRFGSLPTEQEQWLQIERLRIRQIEP